MHWLARTFRSCIKLDAAGNVFVGGGHGVIKYDANGNRLWTAPFYGQGLGLDGDANVYASGGGASGTVKYDASGNLLWWATNNTFETSALVVDNLGNAFVTGRLGLSQSDYVYLTVKYDTAGKEVWSTRYHGPVTDSYSAASAIVQDGDGNIYVTGSSWGSGTGYDYATVKYVHTPIPRLTSAAMLPGNQFRFTLHGEAGRSYTLQASTNLMNWTALTNFVSATGTNQFTDATAANFPRRFYRAVAQ